MRRDGWVTLRSGGECFIQLQWVIHSPNAALAAYRAALGAAASAFG